MFVPISCGVSRGMQLSVSGSIWKNGVWPQRLSGPLQNVFHHALA